MTVPPYQPPGQPYPAGALPAWAPTYAPPGAYAPPYPYPPRPGGAAGWPVAPPGPGGQQWTGFPPATPSQVRALHHTGHGRLLRNIVLILIVLVAIVAAVGKATTTKPVAPNCQPLTCVSPPIGNPIVNGKVYTSSQFGFTVQYNLTGLAASASSTKNSLTITFTPTNAAYQGQLQFAGVNAQGQTASAVVTAVQQQIAPNSTQAYVVPGVYVGYQPGYGEAYDLEATSSDGSTERDRVIILAAVHNDIAIVVIAAGPYLSGAQASNLSGHPTPADLAVALAGDAFNNSVRWPGQNLP